MKIQLTHNGQDYQCALNQPLDISIPIGQVRCFYATEFKAQPYVAGAFVGAVKAGAPVNFFDIQMSPHGNGTHTECLGHITEQHETVHDQLKTYHFIAQLISVEVENIATGDKVITKEQLQAVCPEHLPEAVIIRTIPNLEDKLTMDYSSTNPPYLHEEAMKFLVQKNVRHLLIDLPSVDREEDGGKLLAHHAFWGVVNKTAQDETRKDCTITELIYIPNTIKDGLYLLNIQIPSLPLDAAPSKPVLYALNKISNNSVSHE